MKRINRAALVGTMAVAAGSIVLSPAQAQAQAQAACDNYAYRPHQTPGWVHGTVARYGAGCRNADVVATVYKDTNSWWDELVASNRMEFATGSMTASGWEWGSGDYYTQIRLNGVTVAQSPHTFLHF